jgi:chaperone required for assembly of F1-ATPase
MRELFQAPQDDPEPDGTEAARRAMRPMLRTRFYKQAIAGEETDGLFPVLLDGRSVRTPARRLLAAPARALADSLAAEWDAQREAIDPALMPLTRLANTIIDGVSDAPEAVADDIAKYLGSDLLCYRAEGPAGLLAQQGAYWDPVLAWARDELGARFILSEGVMFVAQDAGAVAAARAAIPADPWRLGAAHAATTLTGSALLALALVHDRLRGEAAWEAAHVDEDWNMAQWGRDELALRRRAFRWDEMKAAATVLATLRPPAA